MKVIEIEGPYDGTLVAFRADTFLGLSVRPLRGEGACLDIRVQGEKEALIVTGPMGWVKKEARRVLKELRKAEGDKKVT